MNALAYNVALVLGIALVGAGAGLRYGIPVALIAVGALVLGLTLFGAFIARRG